MKIWRGGSSLFRSIGQTGYDSMRLLLCACETDQPPAPHLRTGPPFLSLRSQGRFVNRTDGTPHGRITEREGRNKTLVRREDDMAAEDQRLYCSVFDPRSLRYLYEHWDFT